MYEYSCFISYKRPIDLKGASTEHQRFRTQKHINMQIAEEVEKRLREFLQVEIPPFRDVDLAPGDDLATTLGGKICKSACLVALLTPEYFESGWCMGEWAAMRALEARRLGGKKVLIIPIVVRGEVNEIKEHCEGRLALDMRTVHPKKQLDSIRHRETIQKVAQQISRIVKMTAEPWECSNFAIDTASATRPITDPNPLAR